ncbi:DUF1467 family protein [Natrialba asiatica]|uniref:DUF1467 domain-containing protein n=1 Tax=Natrialba asiatica (strain ATCC 700177 / DSM 12278 / JCM 9576 / FERM P-10747 / NBRC 102637 / 172P1) TaxID=29540 RepID=M0AHD2_NATA1|nr:DUF1467 family protein [Natrialba asiatica]ELY97959.1 hypothetical protein C481_18525 [Natrialba asiatica DSM 12278]
MRRTPPASSTLLPAVSAGTVAIGVMINTGFPAAVRTVPAVLLIAAGLFGVVRSVRGRSVDSLRRAARRWWVLAFAAFLPYGLATAPSNEQAAAVGEAFSGPIATTALEGIAGATILCAVAVTVLYWFARYGIHPGRPTPEERILDDRWSK